MLSSLHASPLSKGQTLKGGNTEGRTDLWGLLLSKGKSRSECRLALSRAAHLSTEPEGGADNPLTQNWGNQPDPHQWLHLCRAWQSLNHTRKMVSSAGRRGRTTARAVTCVQRVQVKKKLLISKFKHSDDAKLNILLLPADRKHQT